MKLIKDKIPFTQVANEVLKSNKLTLKAKGLYAYLFSKPDEWDFSSQRMTMESKDGRSAIMAALRELEENNYLLRKRRSDGRMDYLLRYSTLSTETELRLPEPKSEKAPVRKVPSAKTEPISNIDNTSNKDKEVTQIAPETGAGGHQDIVDVIDSFKPVNPSYGTWFGNKTERAAVERMLKVHGKERLLEVISILPKSNTMPFVTTITSPYILEKKWADLEATMRKAQNKEITNRPRIIM